MMKAPYVLFFLAGCQASAVREPEQPAQTLSAGTRVEVATIALQPATARLRFAGEVRGMRDATLASPTGGLIEQVRVRPGDTVRAGQRLVVVDGSLTRARLTQVEARATQARRELERLKQLGDGVSTSQLEQAETASVIADAGLTEAKALLKRATLVAPFAGTVADVDAEVGEVAAPGVPLVHLVSLDPVAVRISVSDRDVVALSDGLPVRVIASARPEPFEGTLTSIRAAANPRTRSFLADVTVPNPDKTLLPGMLAQVQTQLDLGEHMVIPQDWLVMNGDHQGVFLAVDNRAVWRDVKLGQVLENQVIVEGIEPGETLIFTGHRTLLDGDAILISRKARCCESGRPVYE